MEARRVPEQLGRIGAWLLDGLRGLAERAPEPVRGVGGTPRDVLSPVPRRSCRRAGSGRDGAARTAVQARPYNFVSLAHGEREVERVLGVLDEVLGGLGS